MSCTNCDGRKCMDCVTRTIHDACRDDCPFCCPDAQDIYGTGSALQVGPDGNGGYRYRIGERVSAYVYHNAASARADGRRPQVVLDDGSLMPVYANTS